MKKFENNYAFIDSQNLNLAIRGCGWELDFKKLRVYLKDKYQINRAFLFIGYVPGNEYLYTHLQDAGYVVVFKPTLEYKEGGERLTKGNVDAELVLHTMIEYPNYDKALVITGDGDFHCLVEYLLKNRKLCRLIIPNQYKYSALLRKFMGHIDFLNGLEKKLSKT